MRHTTVDGERRPAWGLSDCDLQKAELSLVTWQSRESEWDPPRCQRRGGADCQAAAAIDGLCLNHLPADRLAEAVGAVMTGEVVDLRKLTVDESLWTALIGPLEAVAHDAGQARPIWLSDAVFEVEADFHGWRFLESFSCQGTVFKRGANFRVVDFESGANFSTSHFGVTDGVSADFEAARFKGGLDLNGAQFEDWANFYRARFSEQADLQGASFKGLASFEETEWLVDQRLFGRLRLGGELRMRRATFTGDLLMEVEGGEVNLEDLRYGEALTIRARGSGLTVEHVNLTRPALISIAPDATTDEFGSPLTPGEVDFSAHPVEKARPRIVSLRGSNLLQLTLASTDLRRCLFQGARNVDQLVIEGATVYPEAPGFRSRRRIVCEEARWRVGRTKQARTRIGRVLASWSAPAWQRAAGASDQATEMTPEQLARIYRGLRKSLEETKDFAGASDLYYGEMEMRLRSRSAPLADRIIITLYWLLSGYGLRATRSLLVLGLALAVSALLLSSAGFQADETTLEAVLHSIRSATLFSQSDQVVLTETGEAIQIVLRIIGPALVALTVLAVRARIKR